MRAGGISGLVGRIVVIGAFALAVAMWAMGRTAPAPGRTGESPGRRVLGNVELLSHTIPTSAVLTVSSNQPGRAQFTVTLTTDNSDPDAAQCLSGRNVTVTRIAGGSGTSLTATEQSPGVYQTNNGTGRSGTWRATVAAKTFTGYGGETHTCAAATSNTVTVA